MYELGDLSGLGECDGPESGLNAVGEKPGGRKVGA